MKISKMLMVGGAALAMTLVGCEEKNPVKAAAGAVKDGANAVGNTVAKGADAVKDGAAKGIEATKDTVAKGVDTAKDAAAKGVDAAKSMMADGTKWLTDSVSKQWPTMKTEFDGVVKKVADIKDAGIKTKAEGLITDLKAQMPMLETAVGKVQNFKEGGGDYSKLLSDAKNMWDGFTKKFGDLKALLPK